MSDTLVKVENVSKKFCRSLKQSLWYGLKDSAAELLGLIGRENIHNKDAIVNRWTTKIEKCWMF